MPTNTDAVTTTEKQQQALPTKDQEAARILREIMAEGGFSATALPFLEGALQALELSG